MSLTSCRKNGLVFTSSLAMLLVAIVGFMCAGSAETTTEVVTIPLKRTKVPVKRKGKIVSHKTTYSGQIAVGSPFQHFRVVFDTGSGHVVLPSTECESDACTVHNRYNRSASTSAVDINIDKSVVRPGDDYDEITVNYGTGQISGTLVAENVCVGGTCSRMGMIKATQLSHNPFAYFPVDGIFGLGLGSLALDPEFSFFHTLKGSVAAAQFAMFIAEGDDDSELTVGGFDHARMGSPVQWTPVAQAELGYWQVNLKAIHIGDHTLDACKDGTCRAILDTGTSHLGLPSFTEKLVENLLSTPAKETDDCLQSIGKTVSFEFEDFNITINPENYMRPLPLDNRLIGMSNNASAASVSGTKVKMDAATEKAIFESNLMATNSGASKSHIWCRPLLMPLDLPKPMGSKTFILGEPILRKYYTVFDTATPKIGFGLAKAKGPEVVEEDTVFLMQQTVEKREVKEGFAFVQVKVVAMKRVRPRARVPRVSHADVGTRVTIL